MNIRKIIEDDLRKYKDKPYIYEKKNDEYKAISFGEFIRKSKVLASYLTTKNLKNKNILLIGKNSVNLMIADISVAVYTGVCVNVNRDTKERDLYDIIQNLHIQAILYTSEQEDKMQNIPLPIEKINIDVFSFEHSCNENEFKRYIDNKCCKIFFSSGTSTKPKGVQLSMKNIFAGWEPLQRRTEFSSEDVIYLFLPLHHTYANIYNFYYSLLSGLSIYLSSGFSNVFHELKEVNPTIFCGVPLIYEKGYSLFKDEIKSAFGNQIKYLYVGGAPLDMNLRNVYKKNGLELLNAYALTETASSFSIDYPGDTDDESVGAIFENLDVQIMNPENGIGEIIVKGDAVFLGYATNEKDVFTEDGYFKTGDLGYIKNRKLYVTGRKKKVLIGSNGENISVDEIENNLKQLDSNINSVNVRLVNNDISVVLYLEDKEATDVEKLMKKYNKECVQKNRIKSYEIASEKQNNKLMQ